MSLEYFLLIGAMILGCAAWITIYIYRDSIWGWLTRKLPVLKKVPWAKVFKTVEEKAEDQIKKRM